MKTNKRTVKAVRTAFSILEVIENGDGMTLTEIADEVEMAKSTVHRYLQTFLEVKYLVKREERYYLSLRFLHKGASARKRLLGYDLIRLKVDQLVDETEERVQFIVEEHDQGVYVYRAIGAHAVQTDPGVGRRIELHTTSVGKAILAKWPDERIRALVERRGLSAMTDQTVTDIDTLFDHIERIRKQGFAVNDGENLSGLRAVGVAVEGPSSRVIGGLSVSGPTHRMKGEWFDQELPNKLMGYANEIELNLRHG
jgi:DNA-binding IclR family transcriptional regulator